MSVDRSRSGTSSWPVGWRRARWYDSDPIAGTWGSGGSGEHSWRRAAATGPGGALTVVSDTHGSNPFGDRRFGWLFTVGAAVNGIRWAEIFAFSLITFDLTGSPFVVILVGLVRMVPLIGGALIGLVAHRFSARRVIGGSVVAGAAVHGLVAVLAITERLDVWHLAAASFISGIALAVDFTVRRPLLGSIVPARLLGRAMSLDFTANTVARMVGPGVTGALLDAFGEPAIFVLGVAVYVVAFIALIPVDLGEVDVSATAVDRSAMAEGYRFARRSPGVMTVVTTTVLMNLFVFPYRHFVPVVGTEILGLSATRVGLLTATEGAGMTAAALAMAVWVRPRQFVAVLNGGVMLTAVGVVTFGLSRSVVLSAVAVFAVGMGVAGFASMQPAIVVAEAPPDLRSRVMGLIGTLIGTNPIGLLVLGGLATALGTAGGIVAAGSMGLGGALLGALRRRYRVTGRER